MLKPNSMPLRRRSKLQQPSWLKQGLFRNEANAKGVTAAEKKSLLKQADDLIKQSKVDANNANIYLGSCERFCCRRIEVPEAGRS